MYAQPPEDANTRTQEDKQYASERAVYTQDTVEQLCLPVCYSPKA